MPDTSTTKLNFWASVSVIIGSIIGSGIFINPATMAGQTGSPISLIAVWVLGGLFSLLGALIYAELGAMMPETGGLYIFFKKIFGNLTGFLYGWSAFSVINTAAIAAIAYTCAIYVGYFIHLPQCSPAFVQQTAIHVPFIGTLFPLENIGVKMIAILIILILTYLNSISLKISALFQNISTLVKVIAILLIVGGIFLSSHGSIQHFTQTPFEKNGVDWMSGMIAAMAGAFYAYDGWINIVSMAGEVQKPQRNIPRSLFTGVLVCIIVYVLVNAAYLYVLPIEKMATSKLVATDAITIAIGNTGSAIIAMLIIITTVGAVNGNIMCSSRITYAMAKDKLFWRKTGEEHPVKKTPVAALWLHGIWTCIFVLTATFNMLAEMFVFITWLAYGLGAVGIFLLRKKQPQLSRPYKMFAHPATTIFFIAFVLFFCIVTVYNDIKNFTNHTQPVVNSVLGLFITALGIPVYYLFKKTV
jgi:basic amino acid/polyamine antiporter, APA family